MANGETRGSEKAVTIFFIGFMMGAFLGAVLGFFFAPHSGDITRRKIKTAVGEIKDQTTEMVERKRSKVG